MNIVNIKSRKEFREWLIKNSENESEIFVVCKRGEPKDKDTFYYLDAVEEALCFGWIDSLYKNVDGVLYQKFSKRLKNSNWTRLNIERCIRLEKLGLMTDSGRRVMPNIEFIPDGIIINDLKKANVYEKFLSMPLVYQRIKLSNLAFDKSYSLDVYKTHLNKLIEKTKENKFYGQWNDYGRLE